MTCPYQPRETFKVYLEIKDPLYRGSLLESLRVTVLAESGNVYSQGVLFSIESVPAPQLKDHRSVYLPFISLTVPGLHWAFADGLAHLGVLHLMKKKTMNLKTNTCKFGYMLRQNICIYFTITFVVVGGTRALRS